jgi:hypothetical protein
MINFYVSLRGATRRTLKCVHNLEIKTYYILPELDMLSLPVIPALQRQRQEECKIRVSLGYVDNFRPAWAT